MALQTFLNVFVYIRLCVNLIDCCHDDERYVLLCADMCTDSLHLNTLLLLFIHLPFSSFAVCLTSKYI